MLTPAWTELRPHAVQSALWRTTARFPVVVAGRGSGKTELARRRVVRYLPVRKPWADPEYFYAMPTYGQAHSKIWDKLKALVPPDWYDGEPNESRMEIKTRFGSKLSVIGLDKPMRAEGGQYDGGVIDECSDIRPGTFDRTFRPALTHRQGWCWRIGVSKRWGVGAREFRKAFETGPAFTWPSWDILTAEEVELARASLDPKDFDEQFGAAWVSVAGLVYYCYGDDLENSLFNDDTYVYDPEQPLMIGSDFNVDPMGWVVLQAFNSAFWCIDELFLRNTNTARTLDSLHERYPKHTGGFHFFGDAAGRARHSSASQSDYAQIRGDARFANSHVHYPRANPSVFDRFAAVNAMLRSADGARHLKIHERCVNLRRDLGYLAYKAGTRDVDESDPTAKHITDALGYVIHRLRPLRSPVRDDDGDQGITVR